jgi:hypothetical protein
MSEWVCVARADGEAWNLVSPSWGGGNSDRSSGRSEVSNLPGSSTALEAWAVRRCLGFLGSPPCVTILRFPGSAPVWPFEPAAEAQIVHVEIWPGIVKPAARRVRDAGQVQALVRRWALLDDAGAIGSLFEVPRSSFPEEGWIFGAADSGSAYGVAQ